MQRARTNDLRYPGRAWISGATLNQNSKEKRKMKAFLYGVSLQWKLDIRSKTLLITCYLVPILFLSLWAASLRLSCRISRRLWFHLWPYLAWPWARWSVYHRLSLKSMEVIQKTSIRQTAFPYPLESLYKYLRISSFAPHERDSLFPCAACFWR